MTHPFYSADEAKRVAQRLQAMRSASARPALVRTLSSRSPASPGGGLGRMPSSRSSKDLAAAAEDPPPPPVLPPLELTAGCLADSYFSGAAGLGAFLTSEPLVRLLSRCLAHVVAAGVQAADGVFAQALHLLTPAAQVASSAADSPDSRRFFELLCDPLPPSGCEAAGREGEGAEGAERGEAVPAAAAKGARSILGWLSRLLPSLPGASAAAVSSLLSLVSSTSSVCASHLEAMRLASLAASKASASKQQSLLSPSASGAERERRRAQAKKGRAKLLADMAQSQAAFMQEGGEGSEEGAEESAAPTTPRSVLAAQKQKADLAGLREMLGDDGDACCALCKEGLCRAEPNGDAPQLGIIARVCRQRLPRPHGVGAAQTAVAAALQCPSSTAMGAEGTGIAPPPAARGADSGKGAASPVAAGAVASKESENTRPLTKSEMAFVAAELATRSSRAAAAVEAGSVVCMECDDSGAADAAAGQPSKDPSSSSAWAEMRASLGLAPPASAAARKRRRDVAAECAETTVYLGSRRGLLTTAGTLRIGTGPPPTLDGT